MRNETAVAQMMLLRRRQKEERTLTEGRPLSSEFDPLAVPGVGVRAPLPSSPLEATYIPPAKHGGVRNVARNSNKSEHGFTIFNNREVQHESMIECRVSVITQADPDVVELRSQFITVSYIGPDQKRHSHVFDFFARLKNGTRIGIAVKPERYRRRILDIFQRIKETSSQTDIDVAVMYSDEQATYEKFGNAQNIRWARKTACEPEVQYLVTLLRHRESVEFWQLYDTAGIGHWGRKAAIWRLIDLGILRAFDPNERIGALTRLKINL